MEDRFLLELAIVLISTKVLGLIVKKAGLPQVLGALLAGVLLGPIVFGIVHESQSLAVLAEIGVIMLIFTAGIETNIKEIKNTGWISIVVAVGGIILPLGLGFVIANVYHGGFAFDKVSLLKNIFMGIILTATSISITVETLREMGKLKTKAGTIIMSAAIIDDVVGILLLSLILGFNNTEVSIGMTVVKTFSFFALALGVGLLIHLFFKHMSVKLPKHRRIPIFAFAVCLVYAFVAERYFGVADITGAYIAGIVFAGIGSSDYIERKIDINNYMIFAPVFFAYIGISASLEGFTLPLLWFAMLFVAVGVLSKFIGCYCTSRLCGLEKKDSRVVGFGMIARGEVALVVMAKGFAGGLIESQFFVVVVALVLVTSLLTPIMLKFCFRNDECACAQNVIQ